MPMLLPAIANSSCLSFKILPECHLPYDILPESTGLEFLSCPSLTCRHLFMMLYSLPATFCIRLNFFLMYLYASPKKELVIFLTPSTGLGCLVK